MVRWIWAVTLCSLAFLFMGAALAKEPLVSEPVTADTVRKAYTQDGQVIEVKPLDDAGNPYLGLYSEWDYWVWDHYDPSITFKETYT